MEKKSWQQCANAIAAIASTAFALPLAVGNGNFSTQWSVSGGTVLSSTHSSATIQWNDGIKEASIGALVTNNCPNGQSDYFNLKITGGGPE